MKSSKGQVPKSKEAPTGRLQVAANGSSFVDSWLDPQTEDVGALRDKPAAAIPPFDFAERTAQFGERVIRFAKGLPRHPANDRLTGQLVGAATSVGANYCEANESVSKKDFRYNLSRCLKEAKEARFFLRMSAAAEPTHAHAARILYREATELLRILSVMKSK